MKPVRSGIGWVISTRKFASLSVDWAQVPTHPGLCGFPPLVGVMGVCDGKERTMFALIEEHSYHPSMQRRHGPFSVWVGRWQGASGVVRSEGAHHHWA